MRHSKSIITTAIAAAALGLSACGNDLQSETPGSESPAATDLTAANDWNKGGEVQIPEPPKDSGQGIKIAYFGFGKDNPWSEYMFKGIEDEAKRYGATATFVGPPSFDAQVQFQMVSDAATSQNYDVILLAANDGPSIAPAVAQAIDAGITVVALDMAVGPSATSFEVQTPGLTSQILEDLQDNAEAMADGVIEACKVHKPCKVEVLWGARALAFDKVKPDFFSAKLEDHPEIEIVCETDAGYTQDLGRSQSADCLQAHPDLNVIASQADESTRGAEASIEAANRTFGLGKTDIKLTGSYATKYGVAQVRAGKWLMTIYNRPVSMGRAGVRLALLARSGESVPASIRMDELDDAPLALYKADLDARPEIIGQWEG